MNAEAKAARDAIADLIARAGNIAATPNVDSGDRALTIATIANASAVILVHNALVELVEHFTAPRYVEVPLP